MLSFCIVSGGGHGSDREVTINVKRGVEAKNYGDVRLVIFTTHNTVLDWVTHASVAEDVGRVISAVCDCACLCVCTLKGKWLELSTPNLVHTYSVAVAWHALTWIVLLMVGVGQKPRFRFGFGYLPVAELTASKHWLRSSHLYNLLLSCHTSGKQCLSWVSLQH